MDSGFFILSSQWVSFTSGASFGARTLLFCYFSGCFEDAVELAGGLSVPMVEVVRVYIQRGRCAGMAEPVLDRLIILTTGDQQGRSFVTQAER